MAKSIFTRIIASPEAMDEYPEVASELPVKSQGLYVQLASKVPKTDIATTQEVDEGTDPDKLVNVVELKRLLSNAEIATGFVGETNKFAGTSATFAGLPALNLLGAPVVADAWAILVDDDLGAGTLLAPQYPAGIYRFTGAVYVFVATLALGLIGG